MENLNLTSNPLKNYEVNIYNRCEIKKINLLSWQELVKHSKTVNPFFEPWNLIPALKHLDEDINVKIITITRNRSIRD